MSDGDDDPSPLARGQRKRRRSERVNNDQKRPRTLRRITAEHAAIVKNVHKFLIAERDHPTAAIAKTRVMARLQAATGLSKNAVTRALNDEFESAAIPETRDASRHSFKEFHAELLRQFVIELFQAAERLTVESLFGKFEAFYGGKNMTVPFSRSTLYKVMTEDMGFKRGKAKRKRKDAHNQADIIAERDLFITTMREYRLQNRPIIYVDETWFNKNMHFETVWIPEDELQQHCRAIPDGKGSRAIVVHAGGYLGDGKYGFVNGAGLIFEGKKKNKDKEDYHTEMNGKAFKQWWTQQLLPNVPNNAVIVVDNAKYHNKLVPGTEQPTMSWTKPRLIAWAIEKKVTKTWDVVRAAKGEAQPLVTEEEMKQKSFTKATIVRLCRSHIEEHGWKKEFLIDKLAAEQNRGLIVMRTPVAHCELNPIEMVWNQVKHYIRDNVKGDHKMKTIIDLGWKAFDAVTAEQWQKYYEHTISKVENAYLKFSDQFLIQFYGETSSDDEESDEDSAESPASSGSEADSDD